MIPLLGIGSNGTLANNSINTINFYNQERSNSTGKICTGGTNCNDDITRASTWVGKIGLTYPSDYGYATSGGSATDRDRCFHEYLYHWDNSSILDCKNNNWLKLSNYQWTMTAYSNIYGAGAAFFSNDLGYVRNAHTSDAHATHPNLYLKPQVSIISGDGSIDHPYELHHKYM